MPNLLQRNNKILNRSLKKTQKQYMRMTKMVQWIDELWYKIALMESL